MPEPHRRQRLRDLYNRPGKIVFTAHRGFSGKYPENTMLAFEKAFELGVDIVEFDVHLTRDKIPVVIHDPTTDRTTDGTGAVADYKLAELRKLNASYWQGPHDTGRRLETPLYDHLPIPTLEEVLDGISSRVCLNIQVKSSTSEDRVRIAGQYKKHALSGHAFLMVESFKEAEQYRKIDAAIDLCVGEDRGNLQRHKDFGLTYIQPYKALVSKDFCAEIARLGLCANMFYANTVEEAEKYVSMGLQGIMTDNPHLMKDLRVKGN